jgi:hypothetical protein
MKPPLHTHTHHLLLLLFSSYTHYLLDSLEVFQRAVYEKIVVEVMR